MCPTSHRSSRTGRRKPDRCRVQAGTQRLMDRLSALDAAFLAVEGPTTPMHVGWVAEFDGTAGFEELYEHIAGRLGQAPRFGQRRAEVPLAVHDPVWVDDAEFDPSRHLLRAPGQDLGAIVDSVLSSPLRRDRPLWEITIAGGDRVALVGKMHHCMIDGTAAVQLTNLLLDADPDGRSDAEPPEPWAPAEVQSAASRLARASVDRTGDFATLALTPLRLAASPRRLPGT